MVMVEPIHELDDRAMDGDERKEGRWTMVELCLKRRASQRDGRKKQSKDEYVGERERE